MKPQPMYYHLAENSRPEQEQITTLITREPAVEKVFLLGSTLLSRRTESLFTTASATASHTGQLYLLVLAQTPDEHRQACLQDKLEKAAGEVVPTTILLMNMERFNAWLSAGHPWAAGICKRAVLLFDRDTIPFSPPGTVNEEALQKEQELLYRHTHTRVTEFLAGTELFRLRLQYRMAAFMLHQAAEQALRALLILCTGLRINTHSIEKLLRYCSLFCHSLPDLFPLRTEKEKRLFALLQKAYIDSRYKEDYTITTYELAQLTGKVLRLQDLFEQYGSGALEQCKTTLPG